MAAVIRRLRPHSSTDTGLLAVHALRSRTDKGATFWPDLIETWGSRLPWCRGSWATVSIQFAARTICEPTSAADSTPFPT